MGENWKEVPGYEGIYWVSDLGRIRSKNGFIKLRLHKGKKYYTVGLSKEGKQRTEFVHRLVAMAFLPNPEGYNVVMHINEKKTDNRACNLR